MTSKLAATTADPPFVLICGCPRSGTYLLADRFQSRLGIAIPIETHFVPHFQRVIGFWGDLRQPRNARALVRCLAAYTRIWIHLGIRSSAPGRQARISLLPVLEKMASEGGTIEEALRERPDHDGFSAILLYAYAAFAKIHGMSLYGDKSAPFEPLSLRLYGAALPGLRIIHIVRDGRDVCLSWRPHWFGPRNTIEAARMWRRHVEEYRNWGTAHPDCYLEVRYEDLLSGPDDTLQQIAEFAGIGDVDSEGNRGESLAAVLQHESTHEKLGEPIDPANIGRWRTEMSAHDASTFSAVAGPTLSAFGYGLGHGETKTTTMPLRRFGSRLRGFLTSAWMRRLVRSNLPVLLRMGQVVRLDPLWLARAVAPDRPDERSS